MASPLRAPSRASPSPRAQGALALAGIVAIGLVLRAVPIVANPWPVGDGGLFYTMVGELVRSGLALPSFTSYGHEGIPFAYPPLALELAAALELATGVARAELFRWIPLTFSVLCIPAVYLLAREVAADRRRALFATLVYATFPYAWGWLTMGSGLTRSVGMFFALLAAWQGMRLLRDGRARSVIATGVLAGLSVLSHPEAAVFVLIALGARLLFERTWRNLRNLVLAAVIAAVVAVPWMLIVIARHGPAPFLAAGGGVGRDPVASLVVYAFGFFIVSPLPVAPVLDLLGQIRTLLARRPYLVVWRLAVCFLDLRFALVAAIVPMALLAADGLFDVLVPALESLVRRARPGGGAAPPARRSIAALVAVASLGLLASGLVAPSIFLAPHVALDAQDRAALAWVRATQPADRRFLVLATGTWGSDDLSEWFPALADRGTLDTSQGLEWVKPAIRDAEIAAETRLRLCEPAGLACVVDWLRGRGAADPAVYVPANGSAFTRSGDATAAIRAELLGSPLFRVIYAGPGAVILVPSGAAGAP